MKNLWKDLRTGALPASDLSVFALWLVVGQVAALTAALLIGLKRLISKLFWPLFFLLMSLPILLIIAGLLG